MDDESSRAARWIGVAIAFATLVVLALALCLNVMLQILGLLLR
jgi:hypothetical protein